MGSVKSLTRVAIIRWKLWSSWRARLAGDEHHFRFIQLPLNLAMPEALFFQNQKLGDEYVSVTEAAQSFGVNVIASGSILQGQVARGLPEAIRDGARFADHRCADGHSIRALGAGRQNRSGGHEPPGTR